MKYSKEKLEYVREYLISYKTKIQLSNNSSLLDNARLFENFAAKVLEIIFSKKFINLNEQQNNFPGLDIVSIDNEIYAQVSSQKDIRRKIISTINLISKSDFFANREQILKNLVVVSLNDLDKTNKKIFRINGKLFELNKNLFTINSIITKCSADWDFLNHLFDLCQNDSKNLDNWKKFQYALELSKSKLLDVTDKINNEYSIDRSTEISELEKKNFKNLLIYGSAGVGKTAFAKSFLLKKQFYLFIRAEKLVIAKNLDEMLDFNIKELLENYNFEDDIYIFVDSIESISESNFKFNLLLDLFYVTQKFNRVHILLSCRTFDKINFIKLISNRKLSLEELEIKQLSSGQMMPICKKFKLVDQIITSNKLPSAIKHLLNVPFYLNQIVTHVNSIDEINNIDKLQNLFWKNIICLNDIDCEKIIRKIVIEKSKKLRVAVDSTKFNQKAIKKLLSAGIIIHPTDNEKEVTLRYDIFGDICGEQIFDELFRNCDGNYAHFISTVSKIFGNSVYRRYQIWVEFKLFKSDKSDKFIFDTIFLNNINEFWRKQTIIGIIRSNFSDVFFQNYAYEIVDDTKIFNQFIDLTNLSGFTINKFETTTNIKLIPIGRGRFNLIKIICSDQELFNNEDYLYRLIFLVSDFLNSKTDNNDEKKYVKEVTWQIIKILLSDNYTQQKLDSLLLLLSRLYNSIENENDLEKITQFLNDQAKIYLKNDENNFFSEKIIMFTLNKKFITLIKKCSKSLLNIMNSFFIVDDKAKQDITLGFRNIYSQNCHLLNFDYSNKFKIQVFEFLLLFSYFNFHEFLRWIIDTFNTLVDKVPDKETNLSIYELKVGNVIRKYYGNKNMWTWEQYSNLSLPAFIVFGIRNLCYAAKQIMLNINNDNLSNFFNEIKNEILLRSNNISLFILILFLSVNFKQNNIDCIELISNPDLCSHDNERILLKKILPIGVTDRLFYDDRKETLLIYTLNLWNRSEQYHKKLCKLFDSYLYKNIGGGPESYGRLWNVRKMDFRQYKMHHTDGLITFDIQPTKEMSLEIERIKKETKQIIPLDVNIIDNLIADIEANDYSLNKTLDTLKEQYNLLTIHQDNPLIGQYITKFVKLLSIILNLKQINKDERTDICNYWINIYNTALRTNQSCLFGWTPDILFNQLDNDIQNNEVAEKIYDIMISILTNVKNRNWNNIIHAHWNSIKMFLNKNKKHALIITKHFADLLLKDNIDFYESIILINIGFDLKDKKYYNFLLNFINKFVDSIKMKHTDVDYQLYFIVINELKLFIKKHIFDKNYQNECLSLFWNSYDFSENDKLIIDFYNEIFSILTLQFFDNCCNGKNNSQIKKIFQLLENKISNAPINLKTKFYKILTFSITNEMQSTIPWRNFKPHFEYSDKQIINSQFNKFGIYNPVEVLKTINAFGFANLSPEILVPIENIFIKSQKIDSIWNTSDKKYLLDFITQAYITHSSEIRDDNKLRNSFINILDNLSEHGSSIACAILNEFLIH